MTKVSYYYEPVTNKVVPLKKTTSKTTKKAQRTYVALDAKGRQTKTKYTIENNHESLRSKYNLVKLA